MSHSCPLAVPWRRHVCGQDGAGGGKRVPGDSGWSRPEPAAGHGPGLQVSAAAVRTHKTRAELEPLKQRLTSAPGSNVYPGAHRSTAAI